MRMHAVAALFAACLSSAAHAVVEPGHWRLNSSPKDANGISATTIVIDQTVGGDYTGSFLNYKAQGGTLALTGFNVDEGSQLFVARPGDVISQSLVLNPQGRALLQGQTASVVGQDFWLGVATSHNSDPGFTWATYQNRTTFGWAHFQAQADGTLKLLDSAMAFREGGIVVGTLQAVPEPGTWALMGLGLLGVAATTRRQARPSRAA